MALFTISYLIVLPYYLFISLYKAQYNFFQIPQGTSLYIYIYIYTYRRSELLVPMVNMIKEGCENIFFVSSDHRSQSHLKFQSCLTTEYAGVCFWMS